MSLTLDVGLRGFALSMKGVELLFEPILCRHEIAQRWGFLAAGFIGASRQRSLLRLPTATIYRTRLEVG